MKKSNSRIGNPTPSDVPRKAARVPSVAGKMFRLTSESTDNIH